jgi:hypothetical protein
VWCNWSKETGEKVIGGAEIVQFTYGSNKGYLGSAKGLFVGCGRAHFNADGEWHHVQMTIHLNDVGQTNGRIDACYDGKRYFSRQNIVFRLTPTLVINGILFQSFFGGSGIKYAAPKSTHVDFADFALYQYPANVQPGLCL